MQSKFKCAILISKEECKVRRLHVSVGKRCPTGMTFKMRLKGKIRLVEVKGGEGNGTPLGYSCLENPMDRGAW